MTRSGLGACAAAGTAVAAAAVLLIPGAVAPAAAAGDPDAYGTVLSIMPPGQSGTIDAAELAEVLAGDPENRQAVDGQNAPRNFADQLEMYDRLGRVDPAGLTGDDLGRYFKQARFTVPPGEAQRVEHPKPGVTITYDSFGVPHIRGATYPDVTWGAGYAGTLDRMFLQDILRHAGAARSAEFLGPSESNIEMDRQQLRIAFYTREEAARQVEALAAENGAEGARMLAGLDAFIEGINAAQHRLCPLGTPTAPSCPAEYAALGQRPEPWTRADVVFVASLVGGIFGKGGGAEFGNAIWLRQLEEKYGSATAQQIFDDLREKNDPEAPTTLQARFPYGGDGGVDPDLPGAALPDPDGPTAPGTGAEVGGAGLPELPGPGIPGIPGGTGPRQDGLHLDGPLGRIDLTVPRDKSNALVVGAEHTASGHPVAVFGPQTGYFAPQLLTEQVLVGPHVRARGVAFAGTQLVVQLGRGVDYAWSATSAGSDNVDTVMERLCEPAGGEPTVESEGYLVDDACVPMDRHIHHEVALPNAATPQAPRDLRFLVLRTRHGIVQLRTTVGGVPVAVVLQRSTYRHEVDSVVGFAQVNDPNVVRGPESFQQAMANVDYTFNWFYADARHIAYLSSGRLPVRAPGAEFDLPRWGDAEYDWRGWLPHEQHPQAVDPPSGYLANWNNKQAPGFAAADDQWGYGAVHRGRTLVDRVEAFTAGGAKVSRHGVLGAVEDAATVDVRAAYLLPDVLDVVEGDPALAEAVAVLRSWVAGGAHRADRDRDGAYAHQAAIAVFDEWWESQTTSPRGAEALPRDVFRGELGALAAELPQRLDDHPRHGVGSAWNGIAWYGYLDKDLRQILGRPVAGPYSRTYCGDGSLDACRAQLRASLRGAVSRVLDAQGAASVRVLIYDKHVDDIRAVPAGVVGVRPIDWQNRPTFQQVVEFTNGRASSG
ncbi:MAG: penicillin acylase family protein [Streptomycetales bacterium]